MVGQRFVVTGAASGIGKAVVAHLRCAGAVGIGVDLTAREGDGTTVEVLRADVTSEADWAVVANVVRERLGGLDILVNAAGIGHKGPIKDTRFSDIQRVMGVNVSGTAIAIGALHEELVASNGAILNVASSLALVGAANSAAYCASKGAVVAMTRALAAELSPRGVRVNCICPGPVDTPLFWRNLDGGSLDQTEGASVLRDATLLGRLATVDEIAACIVFMCSPLAAFVTGTVVPVDGGKTCV